MIRAVDDFITNLVKDEEELSDDDNAPDGRPDPFNDDPTKEINLDEDIEFEGNL